MKTYEVWSGDYASWTDATTHCTGYNSNHILEKVIAASLKVKNGDAAYERDSVIFEKIEYSFPVASFLLWIASKQNKLHIIDFGGSLGTSYFQNRFFLNHIKNISWNIVEQDHFVLAGKENFEDNRLKFYHTIDECFISNFEKKDTLLLSGVLQYLENPYDLLSTILKYDFNNIIIDITAINSASRDRLTVQKVDPTIYEASYPSWFLGESKLIGFFVKAGFTLIADWCAPYEINIGKHKGYFFTKQIYE